jgi:tripartite-type tricarboxylate transporter receptor subunit TctC
MRFHQSRKLRSSTFIDMRVVLQSNRVLELLYLNNHRFRLRNTVMHTLRQFLASLAFTVALGAVGSATAQVYPTRPITLIVPLAAGGPTDTLARIIAERMRVSLGQPLVIENVTGAAATIGVGKAARATPDGYTVNIGNWFTHVLNGAIHSLQYDVLNDFEPITLLASNPLLIVAKNAMPAKDLKELIAWLRANPDKASEGTSGVGSVSHVSGVFFQNATGTRFQFVPYRGAGPAMQDLVAGQIDMMFDQVSSSLPYVRSGKIKAYAVTARTRSASASDIPTVDEAGLPGFYVSVWHALWVPKGTSRDVIDKLNAAVVETLADPAVRQRLGDLGQEIPPREQQTPEALGAYQRTEIEKWSPIIKGANIKAE